MTIEALGKSLSQMAAWGSVVPVVIGAFRVSRRPAVERAVLMWMVIGLAINLAMAALSSKGIRTAEMQDLGRIVFAVAGMYAIGELMERSRAQNWLYVAVGFYFCWWMWRVLEGDATLAFGPYNGPALYAMLTISAIALVWTRMRASDSRWRHDFAILVGLGTLVSYGPSVALEPASLMLFDTHRDSLMVLWSVRALLLNIGLLFFSLAFLWSIPHRSSSGSSPSAV